MLDGRLATHNREKSNSDISIVRHVTVPNTLGT
jgi:hypothetical protein